MLIEEIKETNFKFNLGSTVKCSITGFTGVIIYRTQWINGDNIYGVQSPNVHNGTPIESVALYEPQIGAAKPERGKHDQPAS